MSSRQRHFTISSFISRFIDTAAGRRAVALLLAVGCCLFAQVAFAQTPGSNDPSFTSPFGPGGGNTTALLPLPDGKILLGTNGFPTIGAQASGFFRLNSDGSRDTGFPFVQVNSGVAAIALQPDGKILIGGTFSAVNGSPRAALARLNADGTLDAGFTPSASSVRALVVEPDGRILVAGAFTTVNGSPRNRLARLNVDGTLVAGFTPDVNGNISAMRRDQAGKIVIAGEFTTINGVTRNLLARLNADGTLDTGLQSLPLSITSNPRIFDFKFTSDGKIVIGGSFRFGTGFKDIARLLPDGNFDPNFLASFETGDASTATGRVQTVAVQPDGKIVIGGVNGPTGAAVLSRLTSDGQAEPAFTPPGFTGTNAGVSVVALQANGRILVGGNFAQVNDASQPFIARVFAGCLFNPVVLAAPAAGMTGQLAVSSNDTACSFSATADAPWLSITGGSPGQGSGRIGFAVAPNTGGERTGTLTVNGQIFTITQDAVAPTNVNALVTVGILSSASAQPGTCNGVGYADDVIITAKLTNISTVPLTDLSFVVTSLGFPDPNSATGAIPGTPPFRLGTANDFVTPCVSGGLAGSPQTVTGGLAPGQSATVTFRVARPEAKRFRFLMNVMGIATGGAQKNGKTLETASRGHEIDLREL